MSIGFMLIAVELTAYKKTTTLRRKPMSGSPKDGRKSDSPGLEEIMKSHRLFGLQALRELKRAERYCEFLSLVVLDLAGLVSSKSKLFATYPLAKRQNLLPELRDFISRSVRETDLVSDFERDRLGLLLSETPHEGAKSLAKRLEENIRSFLSDRLEPSVPIQVPLKIVSYPDKVKGRDEISSVIQEFVYLG